MSKLNDIRRMREANFERQQQAVTGGVRAGNVRPGAVPVADGGVAATPGQPDNADENPVADATASGLGDAVAGRVGVPGAYDRAEYQRKYMRDTYRPRAKARSEAERAELERLRKLAGEKQDV